MQYLFNRFFTENGFGNNLNRVRIKKCLDYKLYLYSLHIDILKIFFFFQIKNLFKHKIQLFKKKVKN